MGKKTCQQTSTPWRHHMLLRPFPRSKKSGSSKWSVINSWIWKRMICHVKWALVIIWLLHHIIQTGLVNVFELNKKILNHNIWHSLQLVISQFSSIAFIDKQSIQTGTEFVTTVIFIHRDIEPSVLLYWYKDRFLWYISPVLRFQ